MRLSPPQTASAPFANHNIRGGVSLYEAALSYAHAAHAERAKLVRPPWSDTVADRHAETARKLLAMACRLP